MILIPKMTSYDLKGKKLSFADWVSNISPTDTPFCSMTGKESISQTMFQWQTDILPPVNKDNAVAEGSKPVEDTPFATQLKENYTQIFRRGVSVSDTANVVQYYGRGQELGYQMSKAVLELKRDMEKAFLWQGAGSKITSAANAPRTAGFMGQVVTLDATTTAQKTLAEVAAESDAAKKKKYIDPDTGAVLAFKVKTSASGLTEEDVFDMTYNLYLANSKANIIMFHPKHAAFFGSLTYDNSGSAAGAPNNNRMKFYDAKDDEFNMEIDTIVDPLGQKFALVPNRWMPEGEVYFFNPTDWTQMVLRAPKQIKLAKQGSSQEWMIEAEIGLRHRNPYASGILIIK